MRLFVMAMICFYLALNIATALTYKTHEMVNMLVKRNYGIAIILTNIFYAPAWIIKATQKITKKGD